MKTKFAIGTYTPDGIPVKKQKRHNRTYKKKLTKRNQAKLDKELLILFTFVISFSLTQAFCQFTNSFTINDNSVEANADTQLLVDDKGGAGSIEVVDFVAPVPKLSVEQQIRDIAYGQDFQWTDYLVRLAFLESSLNPNAVNVNKSGSIDRGLFQWNDKYHPEISDKCAFSVRCSTIATMDAINNGNQHWWVTNEKAKRK